MNPQQSKLMHLRKDRYLEMRKSKLIPRAASPCKIIEKINNNAYKLKLPSEFGVSSTFNIADLKPYMGDQNELQSRMTPLQEEEDDVDIAPYDVPTTPPTAMQGSMTTARM